MRQHRSPPNPSKDPSLPKSRRKNHKYECTKTNTKTKPKKYNKICSKFIDKWDNAAAPTFSSVVQSEMAKQEKKMTEGTRTTYSFYPTQKNTILNGISKICPL